MCSSSAGAAIAAAKTLGRDFAGEVRFIGTPAEEAGHGKVYLIEAGAFRDVSAALQIHPGDETRVDLQALALQEIRVTFHGRAAHASVDPWDGANALDALITLFNMTSQWRQHLRPGDRVHGIITHGGAAANIIPDETAAHFFVRSPVDENIDGMVERFDAMAQAAAAAAGCTVDLDHPRAGRSRTMVNNAVLGRLFAANMEAAGWAEDGGGTRSSGSTDMGDVSHEVPSIHPHMACAPKGTPGHSREFSAYAGGPEGERTLLAAAGILGATLLDLLRDPALLEEAWRELRVG
jgi:amidohydrolase